MSSRFRRICFLAGGESFSVRTELRSTEAGLQGLRPELAEIEHEAGVNLARASPDWIRARLERLDTLRDDAPHARLEILKHLDGDLKIQPLRSEAPTTKRARRGGHAFEIQGRLKHDGLLAVNQEAACATLVAGAGLHSGRRDNIPSAPERTPWAAWVDHAPAATVRDPRGALQRAGIALLRVDPAEDLAQRLGHDLGYPNQSNFQSVRYSAISARATTKPWRGQ